MTKQIEHTHINRRGWQSLTGMILLLLVSQMAAAQAVTTPPHLSAGVLTVTGTYENDEIQLQVGPAPGMVVILKAPGVADGTSFSGVHSIIVASLSSFSDKVEVKAELNSNLNLFIDKGRGNEDIKLDMKALPGAVVKVRVEVFGESGDNHLEWLMDSDARDLGLDMVVNSLSGKDELILKVESDTPSDRLSVNLAAAVGTSDDKLEATIKSAAAVVDLDAITDMSVGNDNVKIELEQLTPGRVVTDFNIDLGAMNDSGEIVLKGSSANFVVNGLLQGGSGDDSVKLLVEGPATGAPVVDGGSGYGQDSGFTSIGTLIGIP